MTNGSAQSIKLSEFKKNVRSAVKEALEEHRDFHFEPTDFNVHEFPGPMILGFIIRDHHVLSRSAADLTKVAQTVATKMKGVSEGSTPAVLIREGGATVGFMPPGPDILSLDR